MAGRNSEPELVDFAAHVERLRLLAPGADGDELAAANARSENATALGVLQDWGVPERFRSVIRNGCSPTPAVTRVREWAAGDGWCVVLAGGFGVGKSVAAALWLRERARHVGVNHARARRWWTAAELARVGNYDAQAFDALAHASSLVIDDLGAEYRDVGGSFVALFGDLITARHGSLRKTVITTNLNADDLRERYGERVTERLREGGGLVGLVGPNLRRATQ